MSLWDDTNIFMLIGVHVNLFQKKVKKNKISGTKPYNVKLDLLYTTWMSAITIFHYFLQFVKYIIMLMKVKFTQSCPTLCDTMDCTVHGILQPRILEWVAFPFCKGIFPIQWSNRGLPHCRWILHQLSHQGISRIVKAMVFPLVMYGGRAGP